MYGAGTRELVWRAFRVVYGIVSSFDDDELMNRPLRPNAIRRCLPGARQCRAQLVNPCVTMDLLDTSHPVSYQYRHLEARDRYAVSNDCYWRPTLGLRFQSYTRRDRASRRMIAMIDRRNKAGGNDEIYTYSPLHHKVSIFTETKLRRTLWPHEAIGGSHNLKMQVRRLTHHAASSS